MRCEDGEVAATDLRVLQVRAARSLAPVTGRGCFRGRLVCLLGWWCLGLLCWRRLRWLVVRDVGAWLDGYIFALSGSIYAGTNQIQRNIIAERILGLPRK